MRHRLLAALLVLAPVHAVAQELPEPIPDPTEIEAAPIGDPIAPADHGAAALPVTVDSPVAATAIPDPGVDVAGAMRAATVSAQQALAVDAAAFASGSTTLDAVDALLRGDYQRAADILQPIADRWPAEADETAAFFLAALYDQGLGVAQDAARACALYQRAAAGTGPLTVLTRSAMESQLARLSPDQLADCLMLANIGTGHGFAPARFTIDEESSVSVDLVTQPSQQLVGVVVTRNRESRAPIELTMHPGMVFLPIEFTELRTGGGADRARRFLEAAAWVPAGQSIWQLEWALLEISGSGLAPVTRRVLSSTVSRMPPIDLGVRVRDLVDLRVDADGRAEWAMLSGPEAEHGVIDPGVKRRARRAGPTRRPVPPRRANADPLPVVVAAATEPTAR